ncbi:PREDICTED: plexin-C1-like [Cyprinodon variegatus]|uniref:plexin-C1-like n=1 Tax=Cyprinodon variegatus TaxID=28743 RepID=UPI000742AC2C|nr:PREDICTED: plexin-C1-like [Cyprinodon variegatus]
MKLRKLQCPSDLKTINLQNTDQKQSGGIFASSEEGETPGIQTEADVDFVDGFQINSTVFLFSNVASGAKTNKVRLIWLQAETSKAQTLKSLGGATLSSSDGGEGSRLLASSLIPGGQQVLWSGVFSLDGGENNTELLLFDISPDQSRTTDTDPDFYYSSNKPNKPSQPKSLQPKVVLFKKKYLSSVLAVREDSWTVFFIGTTSGELIKLAVDENNVPGCPKVLQRGLRGFPKILLDPVDRKHVYLPFKDQIQRVPVSDCSAYTDVKDWFRAKDPHCVWCVTKKR